MCQNILDLQVSLIPSYLFMLASILRINIIYNQASSPETGMNAKALWLDDENYSPVSKFQISKKSFSYLLKVALCQWLSFILLLQSIMSFVLRDSFFLSPCSDILNLFDIINIFVWWLNAQLLRKEREKNLPQACYTHRLYWILSFLMETSEILMKKVIFP